MRSITQELKQHSLSLCSAGEREVITQIVKAREAEEEEIRTVSGLIGRYDGVPYSLERGKRIVEDGKALLHAFPEGEPRSSLEALADFILARTL